MPNSGPLIIIGGHEDREGPKDILSFIAKRLHGGKLVVATIASQDPEMFDVYRKAFRDLGVKDVVELAVNQRSETHDPDKLKAFEGAKGVFFTGGDQLRITSQIGDTPIELAIREVHKKGGLIAGTSAGASVMSETMLAGGASGSSHKIGDLRMAPGLGLVRDAIIDQHFAERGRIGRLLGAIAHNPRLLGIGIDEDTAIVVQQRKFQVIGAGAVYVADGDDVTYCNVADGSDACILALHDVRLHVLCDGDTFDFSNRSPIRKGGHRIEPFAPVSRAAGADRSGRRVGSST